MAIVLDGKKLAGQIISDLSGKIKKSGKKLKLAAVLVGEDKNSKIFLRQKEKACNFVGVDFQLHQFPENISREVLEEKIPMEGSFQMGMLSGFYPLPKSYCVP